MLTTKYEYEKMARVEQKLWWYRALHEMVFDVLQEYTEDQSVRIIDAGCGTGGLMLYLKERGYSNIEGFDLSADAVEFCLQRGLKAVQDNLTNIGRRYLGRVLRRDHQQ